MLGLKYARVVSISKLHMVLCKGSAILKGYEQNTSLYKLESAYIRVLNMSGFIKKRYII